MIQCAPYNPGSPVYVMVDKIQYFCQAERGTRIVLVEGKEILVGDWPETIQQKINQARGK